MLQVSGLCKMYGKKAGITDVSFDVEEGRIVAVVGPNGSGKTTLFNTMAGIIKADCGSCKLNENELHKIIGESFSYLPDESYLIPYFTPRQMLLYINQICGLSLSQNDIMNTIKKFNLIDFCDKKINALSLGMTKRTAIACTFMKNAELLILDEPTNSIDTQTVIILKDELTRLKSNGAIILISSHILDFAGAVADEVIFIKDGSIVKRVSPHTNDLEKEYIDLFMKISGS